MRTEGAIPRLRVTDVRSPRAACRAVPGLRVYYDRMLLPLVATGAALGAWAYGTYEPNSFLFGRAVGRAPTREQSRLPHLPMTARTLAPRSRFSRPWRPSDVPAAFFLVGEHVRRFPAVARRVAAAGHEVGNHTLRHQKLHLRGPRQIREQLERAHELIVDTTGRIPRTFRAPHGYRNPFVGVATRRLGYTVFGMDVRCVGLGPRVSADEIRARVRRKLRPGAIILLHDGDGYDPHGDRRRTRPRSRGIARGTRAVRGLYLPPAGGPGRVKSRAGRWLGWLLALVASGLALKFFTGFPWQVTFAALLDADRWLLLIALALNLSSLAAKGWGCAPDPQARRAPQLAGGPGGEPGRRGRERPVGRGGGRGRPRALDRAAGRGTDRGAAVSSVVWARVAEGLALALFLVMAPSVLQSSRGCGPCRAAWG